MKTQYRFDAGFQVRMNRIIDKFTGRSLIIPFDHSTSSGPIEGLDDVERIVKAASEHGANAVMLRPGMMNKHIVENLGNLGIILCLTGKFDRGIDHVQFNSVEYALRCGADAVCAEFKLGSDGDLENAALASRIIEEAHSYSMPAVLTIYAIPEYVKKVGNDAYAHACRIAQELGADMIKTSIPQDQKIMEKCVRYADIPIVVAGGHAKDESDLLEYMNFCIKNGIRGAAIGRNVWGSGIPAEMVKKLSVIIHDIDSR